MNFEATKVTHSKYSCAISGMNREMMKIDGRDSVECQNWEKKDIEVIMEIDLNEEKDKIVNSCPLPLSKGKRKRGGEGRRRNLQEVRYFGFRERVCNFSLDLWDIRQSAVSGTRRRTVLRGEGFAWVLDFGSFLKLREVRVSPYLGLFFV